MHRFDRILTVPFAPQQLFDMVSDVGSYPQFLPWCLGARVTRHEGNVIWADLIVGTRLIRERFTSRVSLIEDEVPKRIEVEYIKGPLRQMENYWEFLPVGGGTEVHFHVSFSFRSRLLESVMGTFFDEAVRRMIGAFEKRAQALYGGPAEKTDRY